MRHLVFREPRLLTWEEVPAPRLQGPGEALVRPVAVASCDLDTAIVRGDAPVFTGPFPIGHEFVARVVEVGEGVRSVSTDDLVVVSCQICCGTCDPCCAGRTGRCETLTGTPMYGIGASGGSWGGAIADLVRVPFADAMLVPLPGGVDPIAVASASDNLAEAWHAVAPPLAVHPDAPVLVVGGWAASIGLYAVAVARALGAAVDYADHDPARLSVAAALGARVIEGPVPRRIGSYPITVNASGRMAALACALRSTAPEGTCTNVAIFFADTPVPLFDMHLDGVTFYTGRVNSRAVLPHVLDLVASGRLQPERVTSRVVGWEAAPEALAEPPIKLVIARNDGAT
jgi:alcohol dehydrogenase